MATAKRGAKTKSAQVLSSNYSAIVLIARRTALLLFPGLVLFSSPLSAVCVYVHLWGRVPASRLLYVVRQSLLRGVLRVQTHTRQSPNFVARGWIQKTTRRARSAPIGV